MHEVTGVILYRPRIEMTDISEEIPTSFFVPGDVLALLSPLQEMEPGLYLLHSVLDGWATLKWLIDDEATERLLVTEQQAMVPSALLELFTPVGLRLSSPA